MPDADARLRYALPPSNRRATYPQLPIKNWHDHIEDLTIPGAILD